MATDHVDAIYNALDALLYDADAPFAALVQPGNRSRVDGNTSPRNLRKPAYLPADTVDAELDYDSSDLGGFTSDEHYVGDTDVEDQTWAEGDVHRFLLILIGDDVSLGPIGAAVQAARIALRKGGPDLGLDYVDRLSITRRDTREDVKGRIRRKCVLTISVSVTAQGADELE